MDVERSSLCNCVVNFLLEEKYLLTAFELLHELLEDGRHDHAIRLREFFSDTSRFPSDQIVRLAALKVADPQSLLEAKESLEEKLAISEYELRLAQEDLQRVKAELQRKVDSSNEELTDSSEATTVPVGLACQQGRRGNSFDLGPLKASERRDINCAIKEYLLLAGYKLTAMTFYEEVTDQNLDVVPNAPACVSDALRRYYYQYLSCTDEAAEEKLTLLQEKESLTKENERLAKEKEILQRNKDMGDGQVLVLTKSLESMHKDLKDREIQVQDLKETLDLQRKQLNECRSEITSLKMHIEGSQASRAWAELKQPLHVDNYKEDEKSLEPENLKRKNTIASKSTGSISSLTENGNLKGKVAIASNSLGSIDSLIVGKEGLEKHKTDQGKTGIYLSAESNSGGVIESQPFEYNKSELDGSSKKPLSDLCNGSLTTEDYMVDHKQEPDIPKEEDPGAQNSEILQGKNVCDNSLETIQILSESLPKIVPYVLINHREELLPLMMCAVERHPDSNTRDSLTHTLFNLIKRPDEQQRRIIMDACVSLAKNIGEMRTETELLPQCWEQINHKYEERRLLVAQSCSELGDFVRPEIRDSLILSIVQQLVEDSATVVREGAAHNLALLLPFFPNLDKYFKVEELMFQLVCDPSGVVVETTLKELVPAVVKWGNKLDHILQMLNSHILGSAQRCPPTSGVEGSAESHLRLLGERERWNVNVLLRMLSELLSPVHQAAIDTCPFTPAISTDSEASKPFFSKSLLELYSAGHVEWPAFDWLHVDCFPDLIQLTCLLPPKEDNLRNQITQFLLDVSERYGDDYLTYIMLPIFLVAAGDDANLSFIPPPAQTRINGLRPKTGVAERLAIMCVLPILLAGILGAPNRQEELTDYLRKLLLLRNMKEGSQSAYHTVDLTDAIRFLCTRQGHHSIIFNVLWEMVVSSNLELKIGAAKLLKVLVPYIDIKVASTQVLPALVTLGSDQNSSVKFASIDAFGSVAQHFKSDVIVEKIRIQMDAFLEDGSHEASIAVVRALVVAVPHTTDRLRDYLLSKIFQLSSLPAPGNDPIRHRNRANAFCEAIRALDATDLSATSVRELLLPAIQNLLREGETLDPAHKEALEVILKERSGGTLEAIGKAMGMSAHLGIASSMSSFFGDSGLLGRKESTEAPPPPPPAPEPSLSPQSTPRAPPEDTRLKRIMRGGFSDMFKRQQVEEQQ